MPKLLIHNKISQQLLIIIYEVYKEIFIENDINK